MADAAIALRSAQGEVKIATDLIVDPVFGPVHLLRTVGGAPAEGGGLTDAELRAAPVAVSGAFWQATQPVSGPLTDAQLRAAAVPVSGTFWQATQPVSGTFWQATQPVSGPLTDAQLRATGVPVSATQLPAALESGRLPVVLPAGGSGLTDAELRATPVPVSMGAASVLCKSRVATFRTPGRAGTTGQKILSIHNATGSPVKVYVTLVTVDLYQTVIKAITVAPPVIRLYKVTVLPTNGTALAKTKIGGTGASDAAVTVRGDSSADGTGSGTTLTATLPAGAIVTEEYAPRYITAAGYEMADRIEFLHGTEVELLALEGLVLMLDYVAATQNPITDMWIAGAEFYET